MMFTCQVWLLRYDVHLSGVVIKNRKVTEQVIEYDSVIECLVV